MIKNKQIRDLQEEIKMLKGENEKAIKDNPRLSLLYIERDTYDLLKMNARQMHKAIKRKNKVINRYKTRCEALTTMIAESRCINDGKQAR